MDVSPPETILGSISQMAAALTHYVSNSRLRTIESSIPKIAILTGDDDHLVDPSNSRKLSQAMPSAEYVIWTRTGHWLPSQWPERTGKFLEGVFEEGWASTGVGRSEKIQMKAVSSAGIFGSTVMA